MSKETRTIRPFVGLDELGRILEQTVLRFGGDRCISDGTLSIDLSPHEFLLTPVALEWAVDDEAFSQLDGRLATAASAARLGLDRLSLLIVATSSFLKLADVLLDHSAAHLDKLPRVTSLTDDGRCGALSAPFSGFTVSVYLILAETVAPEPLRPHLKGSWLARTTFTVETSLAPAILPPTPLTKEKREQLGLPGRVVRFLDFGEHDLFSPYRDQERPIFYIDDGLLAELNAKRTAPPSKALQLQLAQDFVSAVVRRAATQRDRLRDMAYEDVRSCLLGSVIRIAAGPGSTERQRADLMQLIAEEPEKVIAYAEHAIDVAAGFSDLLRETRT